MEKDSRFCRNGATISNSVVVKRLIIMKLRSKLGINSLNGTVISLTYDIINGINNCNSMDFLLSVFQYSGKLLFATILFIAMIISTVVSLPFIGAGMIKDAINAHQHQSHFEENNLIDDYREY